MDVRRLREPRANAASAGLAACFARVAPLAIFAALVTSVVACGGGGQAASPAAAAAPPPSAAPPPTPPGSAPDATNGRALYLQHCSACHRTPPDERLAWATGDGAVIVQAIGLVRVMNFLSPTIQPAQAGDIARWLQDPR